MPFSYANPTSGPSAGGIGWFTFGELTISPGTTLTGLSGTLKDGSTVTFDLRLDFVSGQPRTFVATPVPVFPSAFFGTLGYTGITGNAALYSDFNFAGPGINTFTVNNIAVKDSGGNPITNYTVVLADSETSNTQEVWNWQTNGGVWNLLATLGNNPPTLTGLGTQLLTITGNQLFPQATQAANVATTQSPTQLIISSTESISGRQAFSIGFALTKLHLQKNVGHRIDTADQFVLNIGGSPMAQATTSGGANGIQTQTATVYATPGNAYTVNESMAPGSVSLLTDYRQIISASNATPAGSVPPTGTLPVSFSPALGDDVTYTILNAAPEIFTKTTDKAFADVGEIISYTVTVDNPNNFAVNNVLVTDATPAGTAYIGNLNVSAPYSGTDPATGITITTIGPASSVTLSWQVQVNSFPPIPNPVPNYANISVPGGTTGMSNVVTTQVNTAFVSVIKTVDKVYADLGDILTYTLTLNNAGNVPANNVTITDPVPAGTIFVPGSVTGASGAPPTLTLGSPIPAGGSATVTFQVLVGNALPTPNPIPNSAKVQYTYTVNPDNPNSSGRTAQSNQVTTQVNTAVVTAEKGVDKAYAGTGEILTYTLTLNNAGNEPADQVVITDAVPAGTSFVPGSVTGAAGIPPNLTLNSPIPPGGSAVVTFRVKVGETIPTPNPVLNTAAYTFTYTVNPEVPDGVAGGGSSNTVSTQVNNAIIGISKSVDMQFADTGDVLTYTLTLQNTGNTEADQVVITDAVPSGTSFLAGSLTGAAGAPPQFTLLNPILPGGSAVITYQVLIGENVPNPNPIPNGASAAFVYTINPDIPDGASGNVTGNTVYTQVNTAKVTPVKSVDKAYAQPGDILTYIFTLHNSGNAAASQVILTDTIPAGTSFVNGSLTGATGLPPLFTLSGPVSAGGSAVLSFQVKVNGIPAVNPIHNTASVQYTYTVNPGIPGGGAGGGQSNQVTTLIRAAVLSALKSVDKNIAYPGDIVTYHLAVSNSGNVAAEHVILTDTLPNGLQFVPGSLMANAPVSGTPGAIQLINPIAPGATVNIFFKVKITEVPNPNPAINQATVNYDYPVTPGEPDTPGTAITNQVCTRIFRNRYSQQATDIVESAALEQAALAALASAEGAKIQKMAAMNQITVQELLCLNRSVTELTDSIFLLESLIRQKLSIIDCQTDRACF